MRSYVDGCAFLLIVALAACAKPAAQLSAAPAMTTADAAPIATVANADSNGLAKICSWHGFRWRHEVAINPTMTVSNDGYCDAGVRVMSNTPVMMKVQTQPQHGHVTTMNEETSRAGLRYNPDKGYVGSDSFVVVTGNARHEVVASFSVTVTD